MIARTEGKKHNIQTEYSLPSQCLSSGRRENVIGKRDGKYGNYPGRADHNKKSRRFIIMRILNLYAGIGGNRKLWDDVEVTAVEYSKEIADVYKGFYPEDMVVVGDAVDYLMKHYKEFDFVWASPPCQSHSAVRYIGLSRTIGPYDPVLPDFTLYAFVYWFQHHFNDKLWCVENVCPYYEPMIPPTVRLDRHLFWANFPIPEKKFEKPEVKHRKVRGNTVRYGIDIRDKKFKDTPKAVVVKNCVDPDIGDYILEMARDYISLN